MKLVENLVDRRKGLVGSWDLFECSNCGVLMILPTPSTAQLSEYYAAYSKDTHVNFSLGYGSNYPSIRKIFHWLNGDVDPRDFVLVPAGSRVLDYGCGQAGYLIDFDSRGIKISGAEIAGHVVDACRKYGLDVRKVEDLNRIPFDDEMFDVVYLTQVFEHLRNPHGFMNELARVLKPNGTLYLAVPNSRSLWRRVFGQNWVSGWFAPFHLFHYDRRSLSVLANQHGFDTMASWSRTPEPWFRLNLKAWMHPHENQLDWFHSFADSRFSRYVLILVLRFLEIFISERDCLVIKLVKRSA